MHNIDRTMNEMEFLDEFEQDFSNEFENDYEAEYESDQEEEYEEGEFESPLDEYSEEFEEEMEFETDSELVEAELASDMLSVTNEEELEEFIGKLFKKAKKAARGFIKSPAGNMLKKYLKGLAKKALPIAGTALGGMIGGPIGAKLGNSATQMVGKALGLELEGLSPEDKEFEVAKGYVRYAKDAINRAASDRRQRYSPRSAARSAMTNAAKKYAPGFLSPGFATHFNRRFAGRSKTKGTWVRRKDGSIVLYGL